MRRIVCSFMFTLVTSAVASAQQVPTTAPPARAVLPAGLPAEPGQARPTTPPPAAPASAPRPGTGAPAQPAGSAQTPSASVPAALPPPPGRAQSNFLTTSSWQNVKLDVSITDSIAADSQSRKSVSMLVLDGRSGQVRSNSGVGIINVDAIPSIQRDGRIYLQLTLEYQPELSAQQATQNGRAVTMFNESLSLVIADGKPTIASQSSDPRSDRKVTVEVTATVVK